MFETIVNKRRQDRRPHWVTAALSASAHLAVVMGLVLSTLYAADALPEPEVMMAFVVSAPMPPAPPPPAVSETKAAPAPKAQVRTERRAPLLATPPSAALAPVSAPVGIAEETGREGGEFDAPAIEAGFEGGIAGGVAGGIVGGFETVLPPPPVATPSEPVRVGGAISAPRLVHRVAPDYPYLAQAAQIEGMVILEATVDEAGVVNDVRVLRSHSVLDASAVDAVRQWRYEPLMLNGLPTPFVLTVTVSFGLGRP